MYYTKETFEREQPLAQVDSVLPAASYNLTRILLAASPTHCVFVPIRSMQYMAVVDAEEIIFVDSQYKRWVEIAWQNFRPQARTALDQPVAYRAVFYTPEAQEAHRRLQRDFHAALILLDTRRRHDTTAQVLDLPARENT